jgi:hypothetical protein
MVCDRLAAGVVDRLRRPSIGGPPGTVAIVTVNYSTTRLVKLMLLTLASQDALDRVTSIVVVDNGPRDGGAAFLRALDRRIPRVRLVERRHWLHHGPAMRAGATRALESDSAARSPETLLFVDPDVIFRDPATIGTVAQLAERGAALVGEHRRGRRHPGPNIQASFFAVRVDAYRRRDVRPLVHDGAPAYRMQLDIERAGLPIVDLPTNHGGLILHRGRSAVAAASQFRPGSAYASARRARPHFMGVRDGGAIWAQAEREHAALLDPAREPELLDVLAHAFGLDGGHVAACP